MGSNKDLTLSETIQCFSCLCGFAMVIVLIVAIVSMTDQDPFLDATVDECLYINSTYQPCEYEPDEPLYCPIDTIQVGATNADIGGCGTLESCDQRYKYNNIEECRDHCFAYPQCASFTWAPKNGDKSHSDKTVCTLYNSSVPNGTWSPKQILCKPAPDQPEYCPNDTVQVGDVYSAISGHGCGLTACGDRYNFSEIEECRDLCLEYQTCKSFNWTPMNYSSSHPGKTICSIYATDQANTKNTNSAILCKIIDITLCNATVSYHYFMTMDNTTCDDADLYDKTSCSCDIDEYTSDNDDWQTCYILGCGEDEWTFDTPTDRGERDFILLCVGIPGIIGACCLFCCPFSGVRQQFIKMLCHIYDKCVGGMRNIYGEYQESKQQNSIKKMIKTADFNMDNAEKYKISNKQTVELQTPQNYHDHAKTEQYITLKTGIIFTIRCVSNGKYLNGGNTIKPLLSDDIAAKNKYLHWTVSNSSQRDSYLITSVSNGRCLDGRRGEQEPLLVDETSRSPIDTRLQWVFSKTNDRRNSVIIHSISSGQYLVGTKAEPVMMQRNDINDVYLQWEIAGMDNDNLLDQSTVITRDNDELPAYDDVNIDYDPSQNAQNIDELWYYIDPYEWKVSDAPINIYKLKDMFNKQYINENCLIWNELYSDYVAIKDVPHLINFLCGSSTPNAQNNDMKELQDNKVSNDKLDIENEEKYDSGENDKKWKEWTCDDIVNWIISINHGEYLKYESILRISLKKEAFIGEYLPEINKNDLHRFGITSFLHKKYLLDEIKLLINNQKESIYRNQKRSNDVIETIEGAPGIAAMEIEGVGNVNDPYID